MTLNCTLNSNCLIFMTLFLVISLSLQSVKADNDDEEDCGNGCQSYDQDTSQMTRCVRYACRRRVFRYFIRFGKRSGKTTAELARKMHKLHFQQYPLHETISKRYREQEMSGQHRYRHPDHEVSEYSKELLDGQSNFKQNIEQLVHILRNQQRNNNLLKIILGFKRQ